MTKILVKVCQSRKHRQSLEGETDCVDSRVFVILREINLGEFRENGEKYHFGNFRVFEILRETNFDKFKEPFSAVFEALKFDYGKFQPKKYL